MKMKVLGDLPPQNGRPNKCSISYVRGSHPRARRDGRYRFSTLNPRVTTVGRGSATCRSVATLPPIPNDLLALLIHDYRLRITRPAGSHRPYYRVGRVSGHPVPAREQALPGLGFVETFQCLLRRGKGWRRPGDRL